MTYLSHNYDLSQNYNFLSHNNHFLSRNYDFSSRYIDFLSRNYDLSSRYYDFLSHNNDFLKVVITTFYLVITNYDFLLLSL